MISRTFLAATVALSLGGAAFGAETPNRSRQCLNPAETREAVAKNKLTDPAAALRSAAAIAHADPLRSRLCRWNEDHVYEITLLRREGKVMNVFIKAEDGSLVNARAHP